MTNPKAPFERIERNIESYEVDRLPILVLTKMFWLKQLNIPLNDCVTSNPDLYVESQWRCGEEFGHEAIRRLAAFRKGGKGK